MLIVFELFFCYLCAVLNNFIMNSTKKLVETKGLVLLIELRRDSLGKVCFVVTYGNVVTRFRHLSSLLDFIEMNSANIGYGISNLQENR